MIMLLFFDYDWCEWDIYIFIPNGNTGGLSLMAVSDEF